MIIRSLLTVLTVVVLTVAVTAAGTAGAQSAAPATAPARLAAGAPDLHPRAPTGYYLWHDEGGWHLRTHGPGARHEFSARLTTDGTFTAVDAVRLEHRDRIAITDGGRTLRLHWHTYDGLDGVDFRVQGGTFLRFDLELEGRPITPERIFLGRRGHHPAHNPFTLVRR